MAKAETGQVLSTPELLARSRTRFETVDLEPFYVKGKARRSRRRRSAPTWGSGRADAALDLPLLGREAEMRAVRRPGDLGRGRTGLGWWRSSARPERASRDSSRRCARSPRTGCN